jgi:anti-sigma factor RsiW
MNEPHDPFREWDSAYVLGMLSPDDRRAFERHLATCTACAAAVADLAGLPGILSLLTPAEAVALDSPEPDEHLRSARHEPDLIPRLATAAARQRRRRRVQVGALILAASAVIGFSGFALGTALTPPASTSVAHAPALRAMSQVVPGAMTAQLALSEKAWGTRLDWTCDYRTANWSSTPPTYDLVVTDSSGRETTVATWTAAKSAAAGLVASTSVPTAQIRSVEIRVGGVTLVRSAF